MPKKYINYHFPAAQVDELNMVINFTASICRSTFKQDTQKSVPPENCIFNYVSEQQYISTGYRWKICRFRRESYFTFMTFNQMTDIFDKQ